jgi:DMSO/TMAO reductase YedYZ molybdopterin-dependent catalytic subunit
MTNKKDWPLCHDGEVPQLELADWRLRVWGQVEEELNWTWEEFERLPRAERQADLRCNEGWSLVGKRWSGVLTREILSRVRLKPDASFVMVHAHGGYRASFSLYSFAAPGALFADRCDGITLDAEHGWPLRLIMPDTPASQSVKWVSGLEFLNKEWPGTREMDGKPCAPAGS